MQRKLSAERKPRGIGRARKRNHERVALGFDFKAATGRKLRAHDFIVQLQAILKARPMPLPQRSAVLDIGENKSDGPGGSVHARASYTHGRFRQSFAGNADHAPYTWNQLNL